MKKRCIALLSAFMLIFACAPCAAAAYTRENLQSLHDTVQKYVFSTQETLKVILTDDEDEFCAKSITCAVQVLAEASPSAEDIDNAYNGLYSTYALLMIIVHSNYDLTAPSRLTLFKTLSSIVLTEDFYALVTQDAGNEIRLFAEQAVYMIDNSDSYEPKELSASMERFADILYSSARIKSEHYYRCIYSLDFLDVKTRDWFHDAVSYVYNAGLFKGTGAAEFSPNLTMTRGMFMTVLARFAFADTGGYESAFSDVDPESYYASSIAWAEQTGVLLWLEGDAFLPDSPITRQEMVASMYYYSLSQGTELVLADVSFSDLHDAAEWAHKPISWAYASGVISGYDDGSVRPLGTATRAEVAQVFINFSSEILA